MNMKKTAIIALIIVFSAFSAFAQPATELPERSWLTYTDTTGVTTVLTAEPQRIVSLNPNITETLWAIGAGGKLVGRTDYCNYQAEASAAESVGDLYNINIEKVVSLAPDVVLLSSLISLDTITALRNLGVNVIILNMQESLEGTYDMIEDVGAIVNCPEQAAAVVADMKARIASVEAKVAGAEPVSVYYCAGYGDYGDFTATGDTFIQGVLTIAGGNNIASDGVYWSYSREQLVAKDPQVILFPEYSYDNFDNDTAYFRSTVPYSYLTAVRENRMYRINGDIMDRQGPRTADAIEQVAALLHPELFN